MFKNLPFFIITSIILANYTFAQSPGGVTGQRLWLKANTGVLDSLGGSISDGELVGTWQDQGTMATDATDNNLASPVYMDSVLNYNPAIVFDGKLDGLDFGTTYVYSTGAPQTGMNWFAVLIPADETDKTRQKIVDFGAYADHGYGFSYGSEAYGYYTSNATGLGGDITADQTHSRGTEPTLVSFTIDFAGSQYMAFNGASPVSSQTITIAQLQDAQINQSATHQDQSGPVTIGQQSKTQNLTSNGRRMYSGSMAEIIGYTTLLPEENKNRVETYLALKYGLTLSHNYIADISGSGVTTVYDISDYANDIAGVGQDNTSQGLNQFRSKSINTGALIEGTISDANIDEDEYVIWGHDGGSVSLSSPYGGTPDLRITRIWKVTATGTPGSMTISIPTSVAGGLTALIVDDEESFSTPISGSYALSVNGDRYETTVTFSSGTSYFSFITDRSGGYQYPGGISGDLHLWLKADAGVNGGSVSDGAPVTSWADQAGVMTNAATDDQLASPTYSDNTLNNNPTILFDGSDDGLDFDNDYIYYDGSGMTWFAVVEPNEETGRTRQRIVDFGHYSSAGYGFSYGSEAYGFYTSGTATADVSHSRDTSATLITFQAEFEANQAIAFDGGSFQSGQGISGLSELSSSNIDEAAAHDDYSGPVTIGQQSQITDSSGRKFSGNIAEIISYNTVLSTTERNRIETYLALKYGLTLGHNYIADVSGVKTLYNVSSYGNDIAGVGKDLSNQDFSQLTSKSENADALITGTIASANLDDDEYVIWGNDDGSATLNTTFEGETNARIGRIWKITETGSAGSMTIAVDTSISPDLTFLVVSNSSTITSTSDLTGSYVLTLNGRNYEATVNFSSNATQYFTFISSAPGGTTFPGAVSADLIFWLKANEGVLDTGDGTISDGESVGQWQDVSGNITKRNATDTNYDVNYMQQPTYEDTDRLNFNPVIIFDGNNDGLDLEGNYIYSPSSQTGMQWFAVVQPDASGQLRRIVDFGDYSDGGYGFSYSSDYYEFYTCTNTTYGGGVNNTGNSHSNGTNPILINFTVDFNTAQTFALNGSIPIAFDDITLSELTVSNIGESNTHDDNLGPVTIGRQSEYITSGSPYFSGKMAEIICYQADLSDTDENKVETYLALKYGLTLAHNYIADIGGSNTTIYDISSYSNDIAGVAQDNTGQGFNQLTSKSENNGSLVTISVTDGNIDDEEYLVWGNNDVFDSLNTAFEGVDSVRFGTVWKVTETGNVGDVTISIPTSVVGGVLTYILISDGSTMAVAEDLTSWHPLTVNGSNYEATVNFSSNDTQYFTFTSSTDESLPVSLTAFKASSVNEAVELRWTTASQFENSGFEIWKSEAEVNDFKLIASYKDHAELSGDGNSSETREYTFIDHDVEIGKTYSYKLSDVDYNGGRTFHGVVKIKVEAMMPTKLALHSNYPNPFNPTTTILFDIPEFYADKKVILQVFNIVGQRVATLLNDNVDCGRHEITWDSRNDQGTRLPSGLYFIVMQAENFRKVHKMMLVK